MRLKLLLTVLVSALAAFVYAAPGPAVLATSLPTGERVLGQTVIEPAYNDINGQLMYLQTPMHAPTNVPDVAVAPLYIITYPTSAAGAVGTVNCQHQPMDNCPDHGPEVAGAAETIMPSVYGSGVWGHDHIGSAPPAPPSMGDFNFAWEPVLVLFTNSAAANTHITTEAELATAVAGHDVIEIPLPQLTFNCAVVSATNYNLGTPVSPAPPLP